MQVGKLESYGSHRQKLETNAHGGGVVGPLEHLNIESLCK